MCVTSYQHSGNADALVTDSVNLYMDNSNDIVVNRNLIYNTPNPSFMRPDLNTCAL